MPRVPTTMTTTTTTTTRPPRKRSAKPMTRAQQGSLLVLVLLAAITALAGYADADPAEDEAAEDEAAETELPDEPAWDPEPPVTRGAPAPAVNTSTPTPNGLKFGMELKVGLATKPVAVDASGTNGGKVVVLTTGRWKAAAGPEKVYAVILERYDGKRWAPVGTARPARVGASKVRHEWPVRDRAQYRATVMARRKGATGPLLRVEGELRTILYR